MTTAVLAWMRLARVYQKVDRASAAHLRRWGLSVAQFDVLARVGGLIMTAPIFGTRAAPVHARAGLAITMTLLVTPLFSSAAPAPVLPQAPVLPPSPAPEP